MCLCNIVFFFNFPLRYLKGMNVTSLLIIKFLNSFPATFFLAKEMPNYSIAE